MGVISSSNFHKADTLHLDLYSADIMKKSHLCKGKLTAESNLRRDDFFAELHDFFHPVRQSEDFFHSLDLHTARFHVEIFKIY